MPFCVSVQRSFPVQNVFPGSVSMCAFVPLYLSTGRFLRQEREPVRNDRLSERSALGSPSGRAGTRSVTERVPAAAVEDSPCHCVALPPHKCGGQGLSFCCTSHPEDSTRGIPFGLTPVTSVTGKFRFMDRHLAPACVLLCLLPAFRSGGQRFGSEDILCRQLRRKR